MNQKDRDHWKSRVLDEIFAALAASQPSRRIFHLMKRRQRSVPSSAFWRRSGLYRSPFPCRIDPEGLRPTAFKNPSACAENHSNPIVPKTIQQYQ